MAHGIFQRRWPWFTAAALAVVIYLSTVVEIRFGTDPRPVGTAEDIVKLSERKDVNLLFVLIDMLRAERLGCYGYERDTSPILDVLASSGVRFARQLSQSSWTKCSMASLWTAMYPVRSGITRFEDVLPVEARMPAEILRDAGFRTTGLWRNGWVEGYFGFGQGFEVYDRPAGRPPPPSVRRENPTVKAVGTDTDVVDAAIEFLRVRGAERWFLYLHMMDVHEYLYDEDTAVFGTSYSDVYDNAVLRENRVLNLLLLHLQETGQLEHTLIAISADHGEAFGERGLEGHARRVYRETTEVPFILAFPFRLEPGVVVQTRTRNVDVWPTLLDLLGLPPMEGVDGRSRVPEILTAARGEPAAEDGTPAYAHLDQNWGRRGPAAPTVAVTEGSFRYVRVTGPGGGVQEQLFDAAADPREQRDVLEEREDVAARLRALAKDYLERPVAWSEEAPALEMDEMQLDQLRALGYAVP